MKKLLLMMLTVLIGIGSLTLSAQNTLTVADGTSTNSNVPIYGTWADAYLRCQTIYPASTLDAAAVGFGMNGGTITSVTYYLSTPATDAWTGTWEVKLMEVTDATLSGFLDMTNATTVYTDTLDGTVSPLVITFTTPYVYQGGNLVIEVSQIVKGNWKSASFYGVSSTGASWQGYNSSAWTNITGSAQNFMPKTTFTFTGGTEITCSPVQNLAINAAQTTSSSMTLTWSDAANTGATYTVYDMSDNTVIESGITATTYTVTNLNANTSYTFGVEANCSATDASAIMTISDITACGHISTLPFTEDFESVPSGSYQMPYCWERYASAYTSAAIYPYSYSSSTYAHSGSRSLYFYGNTGSSYSDTMVAIMPELDVTLYPMNGNRVTFWARMSAANTSKTLFVGTMTDPTDPTTLVLVDSVLISSNTYTKYIVPMTNATGSYVTFVAFKGNGTIYMDDLTLEESPSCFEVTNLTVSATTTNSITLTWNDTQNPEGTDYTIYNMADTSNVNATINGDSALIENLDANTLYTFGVESNCASGDDAAIVTVSGRTDCDIFAAPYTWTFEDMTASAAPICWTKIGTGTVNVVNNSSYSHNGTMFVRFSGSTSNLIALPETQDEISTLQLRFWTRPENFTNTSCGNFSVGYITDITDATTFVEVANYVYSDFSDYNEKTVIFAGAPAGARMAMRHNAGSTSWYWYIDDVTIENAPDCLPVSGLTVSNITTNDATLSWTGDAASYVVYDMSDTSVIASGVPATTYDISGLDAMTSYTYGVAAECGADISPIVSVSFTTACTAVALPYTETFESTSSSRECWNMVGYGNLSGTNGMGFFTINGRETMRFSSYSSASDYNQYGFSPLMDVNPSATNLMVNVVYATYNANNILNFGYVTATDTVWLPTDYVTSGSTDWQSVDIIIPANATQFAIHYFGNYSYYAWIDSVNISEMYGDYCYAITGLEVTDITSNSISLSWSDENNDGATYTIYNMDDNSVIVSGITTTDYDVTGLTASTSYTFGVEANCSASSESSISTISAVTMCASGGCQITIVGIDSWGDGWNGNAINVIQDSVTIGIFTVEDGNNNTESFTVCSSSPVSFSWTAGSYPSEASFNILDGSNMPVFSGTGSDMANDSVFYTMNEPCPSCLPATNLTVTDVTTNSVTISWTGSAPSYDVYNGSTFVVNVTTNTYTFTGLNTATDYVFSVQAICSTTDISAMVSINVTTECEDITTLPYNEGFENGFGCWSTVNGSSDGLPWIINNCATLSNVDPHGGNYVASSWSWNNNGAMHADAWLISPKFVLPNTTDSITFTWWEITNGSYPDSYSVVLSTTTKDTAAFTTVVYPYSQAAGSWTMKGIDLTQYAGQSVYIAFHHMDYNENFLLIDDISLFEGSFVPPTVDTLTVTFTVNNAIMGTTVPAPGTYHYFSGDTVYMNAVANAGFQFIGWQYAYGSNVYTVPFNPCSFLADSMMSYGSMTITALFAEGEGDDVDVTFAVNNSTMGTTSPAPGTYSYQVGASLQATAIPNEGYHLSAWLFDLYLGGVYITTDTFDIDDVDFANPMNFGTISQTIAQLNGSIMITAVFASDSVQPCDVPTGLHYTDIQNESIAIAWDADPNVNIWNIQYRMVGSSSFSSATSTTNSYNITNLTGLTNYEIQVQAVCENGTSDWCEPITVQTTNVGIEEHLLNSISLFPNPANDVINVQCTMYDVQMVEVIDVYGKLIQTINVTDNLSSINVSNLASGMYFVRVTTEEGVATKSFVKR